MREDRRGRAAAERERQAAGVVVVAMAQDDRLRRFQRNSQGRGIGLERRALPGVEQHVPRIRRQPEAQPVFRGEARRGMVIDEDSDSHDRFKTTLNTF